ncbi:MAG TPA: class II glutamine amidotransferase [Solirubrobacteraceae bacterium]|jgi:glutamine amidotransferase
MCRWMAWHGQPVLIDELLFKTQHGLVDQSLHSRMGAETTNGDGFGLGWYGTGDGPGVYRSVAPAWGDANLRHLASHIESPLFLSHIRAAIGSPVQETNCHPFRHGDWLFVHNGLVNEFHTLRRDLALAVDPDLFADIQGSTDSEVLFHLALTYGLHDDPIAALERVIGFVEDTAVDHDIEPALQISIGVSDGARLWAVRYASRERPRTLFVSTDADALRRLHPENPRLQRLREGDRVIVSEPIADLPGAWHEIPQDSAVVVSPGGALEHRPFTPQRSRRRRLPTNRETTVTR